MPPFIGLAELDFQTKVARHPVASQRNSYGRRIEADAALRLGEAAKRGFASFC
jgi:hypothetical protein